MADHDSTSYGVIYCIEHRESGKRYVGQTIQSIKKRWLSHKRQTVCVRLHRAIKKYGDDAFDVYELDVAWSKDQLDALEDFYIRLLNTTDERYGYNLRSGGSFGRHSDESRKKMSERILLAYATTDLKEKRRQQKLGSTLTDGQRRKLREANIGKAHSKETIRTLSERRKMLWQDENIRENMRQASIAARSSDEFKARVAEETRKQWGNPETRARLMEARAKTQAAGNEARKAAWADPVKRAARLEKLAATRARKRMEAQKDKLNTAKAM